MKKTSYETPLVEAIQVTVEAGFSTSPGTITGSGESPVDGNTY